MSTVHRHARAVTPLVRASVAEVYPGVLTANSGLGRWVLAVLAGMLLALSGAQADVARPQIPPARGEQCVEPVEIMRRDHFEFLRHQRDQTMRLGVRALRHSLAGCIDCHASRDAQGQFLPVTAQGQFCQGCHAYTAVKIDCFSCHASVPESLASQAP